jgi:hypothetical protein
MSKQSRKKARQKKKTVAGAVPPGPEHTTRMPGRETIVLGEKANVHIEEKGGTVTLPARKNRDGTFTVNPGTPEEYIIRDPTSGFPVTGARQTYAPMVQGPKDLPALRHHIVDRVTWQKMDNKERQSAMRDAEDLAQSQLWWIADDVVTLAAQIGETIPDETTLDNITLPPHAHGFAVFAKPIVAFGIGWGIYAIDWHPVQFLVQHDEKSTGETITGFRMTWWAAPDLGDGLSTEMMADPLGSEALKREVEMQTHKYGEHRMEASLTGRTWIPHGTTTWIGDAAIEDDSPGAPRLFPPTESEEDTNEAYLHEAVIIRKILAALWIVSRSEKITETRPAPADRAERRRRERAGFGIDPVQVVQLRPRPKSDHDSDDGEGESGNYHHRWVVSPHLRWQPYGPNSSLRKLILVEAYLKGPEGAPLLDPKKKVWKVS